MRATEGAATFLSGIILAAGASARMGRPKQLLPLGDRCLLQYVLDAAGTSGLGEILLVLGHRAEEIQHAVRLPGKPPTRVVLNPDHAQGQSTSLRLGLRAADPRARAAAILLGDQPWVTGALIDRVAATFVAGDAPVVRPVYCPSEGRQVPGHPVILAREIWPEVEKLDGDRGARELRSSHPEWFFEMFVEGDPPADLDTWDDYRRAVEKWRGL